MLNLVVGEKGAMMVGVVEVVMASGSGDITWCSGLELEARRGRLSENLLDDARDRSLAWVSLLASSSLKSDMLWRSLWVSSSLWPR